MILGKKAARGPGLYDIPGMTASLHRMLNIFIWALGLGSAFSVIANGAPFTGLVKHVGVSDLGYSVLVALPFLGGPVQLIASSILERRRNRRSMMLISGIAARIVWIGVGLVPLLAPGDYNLRLWALLMLCSMSAICGGFLNASFFSLLGDAVPGEIRGRYLALRSRAGLAASLVASFGAAWLLDALPPAAGYLTVFSIAAFLGVLDIVLYFFIDWPPMERHEAHGFFAILREALRDKKFVRICVFWMLWYFSLRITYPFWTVYELEYLGMSYRQISIMVTVLFNLVSILMVRRWGWILDRYGAYAVTVITCALIVLVPIPYLFAHPGLIWVVPLGEMLSGIAWSGSDLASMNMYLGQTPQRGRSVYIAIYMICTQMIGSALAFIVGGWLADNVTPVFETFSVPLISLTRHTGVFIISLFARLPVLIFFLPRLRPEGDPPFRDTLALMGRDARARLRTASARRYKNPS